MEKAARELASPKRLPARRRLLYSFVVYFIFILTLVGIELVTRVTLPKLSSLDLFVSTPQQRMQVADEKQSSIFEGDPMLLWRVKPNLRQTVWDFTVISTNAAGLRAEYPTRTKPAGTFRIVCLGDSVTFGYRVPVVWPDRPTEYDHTWLPFASLIEKELREANQNQSIESFPMAVPGYTSHQGLAWLRRDIDYLQPDVLIASFGWNDASLSDATDREIIKTNRFNVAVRWMIDHSQAFAHATYWFQKRNYTPKTTEHQPRPRVSEDEYVNNMKSIVEIARSRGASVIVIGAPYRDKTTNPTEAERMVSYRAALRVTMQRSNVPYLEVLELTEAAGSMNDGFFGELIHPNHMGHRLLASELLKLMARNRMLGEMKIPEMIP